MNRKTSYSNQQLANLIVLENHQVIQQGDFFQWSRDIGTSIETIDIDFESSEKAYEYIYYNISLWNQELTDRINDSLSKAEKQKKSDDIHHAILTLRLQGYSPITYDRIIALTGMSKSTVRRFISKQDKEIYINHGGVRNVTQ